MWYFGGNDIDKASSEKHKTSKTTVMEAELFLGKKTGIKKRGWGILY